MISVDLQHYFRQAADGEFSRIAQLGFAQTQNGTFLLSTTRDDGEVRSWGVDQAALSIIDTYAYNVEGSVVVEPLLTPLDGDDRFLIGGGVSGGLQTIDISEDGRFAVPEPVNALPVVYAGLRAATTVNFADGRFMTYGGIAGESGLARLAFGADGNMQSHAISAAGQIAATASAGVDGRQLLFTADTDQNALSSWAVQSDGTTTLLETVGADQSLWINAPTRLETVTVGSSTYLILASAGSSSISVLELGSDGSLTVRDHIIDSLQTRFSGVTALSVVQHEGRTLVIAGGADDGVSIFELLEGGFLVSLTHVADTTEMGLANVSALAARGKENGVDLFVASASELGITKLRLDLGTAGATYTATLLGGLLAGDAGNDILQGLAADDILVGNGGDDILRDGDGTDSLRGGAGADIFILASDGATDTIEDFAVGKDRIDLSLWPLLRDISQLTMRILPDGMQIDYGQERLIIRSSDGNLIDYRLLQNSDLLANVTRLPSEIQPGYPGPATPQPELTPSPDRGDPADPGSTGNFAVISALVAARGFDALRAAEGISTPAQRSGANTTDQGEVLSGTPAADTLVGEQGPDILIGLGGNDRLEGGAGNDVLLGRDGNDQLFGDSGGDILKGGGGDDTLSGGSGQDLLHGGAGADILKGGLGDDILFGQAGADTFIFDGGSDQIKDFAQGIDEVMLDQTVWRGLTSATDILAIYGSIDGSVATVDLGNGDQLVIEGVTDFSTLAADISIF